MKITYDHEEDVLYLTFIDSEEECDYVENPDGVVLRIGLKSGQVLGCTVMWFMKKLKRDKKVVVPEIGPITAPEDLKRIVGF